MDLTSMMKTMLSADSITQMSEKTGTSTDEVKAVLLSALPAMLNGVQGQACNQDTVAGFAGARIPTPGTTPATLPHFFPMWTWKTEERSSAICSAGTRLRR